MKKYKYGINTIHDTNNCGKLKIIGYCKDRSRRKCRFIDSGVEKEFSMIAICYGECNDGTIIKRSPLKYLINDIYDTNNCGKLKIIGYCENMSRRKCRFLDSGVEKEFTTSNIRVGNCSDGSYSLKGRYSKYLINDIYNTNNCGKLKIIGYCEDANIRKCRFLDSGIEKEFSISNIRKGNCSDGTYSFKGKYSKYLINDIYDTNNCGKLKIIGYCEKFSRRKCRFLDSGVEKEFNTSNIRKGSCSDKLTKGSLVNTKEHGKIKIGNTVKKGYKEVEFIDNSKNVIKPEIGKFDIGTYHKTKKYGMIKIIGSIKDKSNSRYCIFMNTNYKAIFSLSVIISGKCVDKTSYLYNVDTIHANRYGRIKVLEIPSSETSSVRLCEFIDGEFKGETGYYTIYQIKTGNCNYDRYPVGSIHKTHQGKEFMIIMPNVIKLTKGEDDRYISSIRYCKFINSIDDKLSDEYTILEIDQMIKGIESNNRLINDRLKYHLDKKSSIFIAASILIIGVIMIAYSLT